MRRLRFMLFIAGGLSFVQSCTDTGIVATGGSGDEDAGPPVTRSEVVLTADRYARVHWTMTEENRTGVTCDGNFLSNYPVGDRIGVGYMWGGWTDVDTFIDRIEQGYGTGTGGYVTYEDYEMGCIVGVSCTGLVSRAWNLDEKYTLCYEIPGIENKLCEIAEEVEGVDFAAHETAALMKGDAFVNDTHTILFIYETRSGAPMIIDSTLPGVKLRKISWESLADEGYIPIRYYNIRDDLDPEGTIINPVVINDFDLPAELDGNTRNVVSMEFDHYPADPSMYGVGPEVIYELHLSVSGTLNIHVTEVKSEGIDNNVHLLSSLAIGPERIAVDCIASHDNTITRSLEPGTYYIIVDGGNDTPGEYTLTVGLNQL